MNIRHVNVELIISALRETHTTRVRKLGSPRIQAKKYWNYRKSLIKHGIRYCDFVRSYPVYEFVYNDAGFPVCSRPWYICFDSIM